MQEMWVQSLGWEDLLEEGIATQYSCLENHMNRGARWATVHRVTESDMSEQLNHHHHSGNILHDEEFRLHSDPNPVYV